MISWCVPMIRFGLGLSLIGNWPQLYCNLYIVVDGYGLCNQISSSASFLCPLIDRSIDKTKQDGSLVWHAAGSILVCVEKASEGHHHAQIILTPCCRHRRSWRRPASAWKCHEQRRYCSQKRYRYVFESISRPSWRYNLKEIWRVRTHRLHQVAPLI